MFKKALIASGPTLEPIDPVRFISNHSSGKTGYFLAREAQRRGIRSIVYVTGPSAYLPDGVHLVQVQTARQMQREIRRRWKACQVIIMAAAVCDFRPQRYHRGKIKKRRLGGKQSLILVPNPDILRGLGASKGRSQVLVGFAAETKDAVANARRKLEEKNLDLIVANEISPRNPAFGAEENRVCLISGGRTRHLPRLAKSEIAAAVWDEIERIGSRKSQP